MRSCEGIARRNDGYHKVIATPAGRDPQTRPPTDQAAQQTLIRLVECAQGQVELEVVRERVFDYAREPAAWELSADEHGGIAHGGQTQRDRREGTR